MAGLITAWNANTLFICLKLASAVAAGCTVVIKPSEMSSLQTRVLIEALHEAKLPKGLLNVVTGRGNVVGAELVRNPDVAKISFTGSVAVGKSIMRDGAATMKRVTLELGGKSPTILLDDADLDQAIPAALVMAFMNSGQACAAGTRLLVPKSRLDAVKRAIGTPCAPSQSAIRPIPRPPSGRWCRRSSTNACNLTSAKASKKARRCWSGARVIRKGLEAGYFVKPTVFVNVKNDMTIAQEEIFGPVLCVIAYDSEDEAIRIANDSKYGLHASVLGTDIQRARRVASQIRAGRVVINGMTDDPQAPWGGFKYSGVGREYGRYGIEAFLETRAILECVRRPLDEQARRPSLPNEAADRLAIRELVEAYAHCADRRDAKGQMSLFTADTHFVVYMNAKDPKPSQELHSREALAPVFAELNQYDATMHSWDRARSSRCRRSRHRRSLLPRASRHGRRRQARLMVASFRYLDTFVKIDGAWLFRSACSTSTGWRNAHYHEPCAAGPGTPGHRGREGNGRRIRPALGA